MLVPESRFRGHRLPLALEFFGLTNYLLSKNLDAADFLMLLSLNIDTYGLDDTLAHPLVSRWLLQTSEVRTQISFFKVQSMSGLFIFSCIGDPHIGAVLCNV